MFLIIISIIATLLLLDFSLIGFTPKILGIWGPLNKYVSEILIEDTAHYSLSTDINGEYIETMINSRVGYKSLILTPEFLIVKNTFLTYLLKIDNRSIKSYTIKNELIGKKIKLLLKIMDTEKFIEFSTSKSKRWIKEFSALNISESKP